jgi:hypothetical protein
MRDNVTQFNDYSKTYFQMEIELFALNFLANQTQTATKAWENLYLKPGASDDNHLAWLEVSVAVRFYTLTIGNYPLTLFAKIFNDIELDF